MDTPESAEEGRARRQDAPQAGVTTGRTAGTIPLVTTPQAGLPPRQSPGSVPLFLLVTVLLFMLTNNRGDQLDAMLRYTRAAETVRDQIGNYTAWINGTATNFSMPEQAPAVAPLVDAFLTFGSVLDPDQHSYYSNLTGFWHGDMHCHNITSHTSNTSATTPAWQYHADELTTSINMTALPEMLGQWNWSSASRASLSIGDKRLLPDSNKAVVEGIAMIHGKFELSSQTSGEDMRLDFDGVHFQSNGSIYALARPAGHFVDLRDVPSLVPEPRRNDAARAVTAELTSRMKKLQDKIDSRNFDMDSNDEEEYPKTRCSFAVYGQLVATNVSQTQMKELEDEIDNPTGIHTVKAPVMKFNGVLLSQDCGILYEVKNVTGLKSPRLFRKITTYAGFSAVVYFALLVISLRQIARSSSAAGISRVSRYPFLAQALIDVISFVGHITVAILAEGRPSIAVLAPAALACVLFYQEAQFAILIGRIQAPEDSPPPATAPRPAPTPAPVPAPIPAAPAFQPTPEPSDDDSQTSVTTYPPSPQQTPAPTQAPAVAPAPTPTTPQRQTFLGFLWHHIRTDPAARLWTMISLFLLVVFRIILLLSLPLAFIGTLYACLWLAQIYRSAKLGRSSGLSAEYLVGITAGRLYFALYFLTCPYNILEVEPRRWIWAVAVFIWVQVATIILQGTIHPGFFLGRRTIKSDRYDYHPLIPLPDPEAPEQSLGDCAICMDAILVDPGLHRRSKSSDGREEGLSRRSGWFDAVGAAAGATRKSYSLAPCHHLFHTACLERWLAIKNICPQCRRPLPSL